MSNLLLQIFLKLDIRMTMLPLRKILASSSLILRRVHIDEPKKSMNLRDQNEIYHALINRAYTMLAFQIRDGMISHGKELQVRGSVSRATVGI
jgi:hypothetical protein